MRWGRLLFEGGLIVSLLFVGFLLWMEGRKVHAPFLPHFVFQHESDTVVVQGTWRREDGDDANPSQTTTIECERATRRCLEASAVILGNDVMAPVIINQLSVRRWDDASIVVEGAGARCVEEVYELHLASKAVTGLVTRRRDAFCDSAPGAELARAPVRMRMIDGYQASWAARGFGKAMTK